jgi:hypothetical protein
MRSVVIDENSRGSAASVAAGGPSSGGLTGSLVDGVAVVFAPRGRKASLTRARESALASAPGARHILGPWQALRLATA